MKSFRLEIIVGIIAVILLAIFLMSLGYCEELFKVGPLLHTDISPSERIVAQMIEMPMGIGQRCEFEYMGISYSFIIFKEVANESSPVWK